MGAKRFKRSMANALSDNLQIVEVQCGDCDCLFTSGLGHGVRAESSPRRRRCTRASSTQPTATAGWRLAGRSTRARRAPRVCYPR